MHLAYFNCCESLLQELIIVLPDLAVRIPNILHLMRYFYRPILMDCTGISFNLNIQIKHGCALIFWLYCVNLLREVMLDLCNQFWSFLLNTGLSYCYLGWHTPTYTFSCHLYTKGFIFILFNLLYINNLFVKLVLSAISHIHILIWL